MTKQYYKVATYRAQESIGYLVKCAQSLMMDILEPALVARGFTFLQYSILAWVRDGAAVNPKDISKLYGHDSGSLTRVLDQLTQRGLLARVRRDRDRRKVGLQLTAAGDKAIDELIPLVADMLKIAMHKFSKPELQEFDRLMRKLTAKMSRPNWVGSV